MSSAAVRARIVELLRRDLVGPNPPPADPDLQRERLSETPSRWYLTGFLAPAEDEPAADDPAAQEELELEAEVLEAEGAGGAAGDREEPEAPSTRRRFLPSSVGLTVLLPLDITELEAVVTWGDYVTEPPLPPALLLPAETSGADTDRPSAPPRVDWVRLPQERTVRLSIRDGRSQMLVPECAAPLVPGGALELTVHARTFAFETPEGDTERVRAVTVFLVNRRRAAARRFPDASYAFQARLDLLCPAGFRPRYDLSGYRAQDEDLRLGDLHYRDVEEYAVGRNAAAAWITDADGRVRRVYTDPLPLAEVERVAPNEDMTGVEFGMEALARLAADGAEPLAAALERLPILYEAWIAGQRRRAAELRAVRRRETTEALVAGMTTARNRIAAGIALLAGDACARLAFRLMNEAVARAARRRDAGLDGDPAAQTAPAWRPFQLAFIC